MAMVLLQSLVLLAVVADGGAPKTRDQLGIVHLLDDTGVLDCLNGRR